MHRLDILRFARTGRIDEAVLLHLRGKVRKFLCGVILMATSTSDSQVYFIMHFSSNVCTLLYYGSMHPEFVRYCITYCIRTLGSDVHA
jgi:hypothetical protein